ncbi:TIGR03617 family F420-dependent LLM class oxidoreductase [Pseudonocardia endophytica]|uniref:Putative F420-dependent oxidoreductase n=1 Tax=Pseudonocardia endophytica TaxID=401976 RepID=A0A4R1I4K8_PSEEN|nr:TIGR03617 family F420-dependent LLM class oxidoreductase [Pseudonocardia endophytica]TCK24962.1 putative F420-dependent oxidoreductase [Pseudonocardia endophytica]
MKIDARLRDAWETVTDDVRVAEEVGYDGAWNAENTTDPFPGLALAAEHSSRIEVGPSVAIAFARTPMTVANPAWNLQRFSGGRLVLGLGSQIRPHVTRRFSMPWSRPAARMHEFVTALRAIWHAWETGGTLEHRGEFYDHSLMTPNFVPPPNPYGPPAVFLAAVGPHMLRTTAQVADGLFAHPFLTERYLREVMVPEIAAHRPDGAEPLEIALSPFVALDEADREAVRRQISFYGSTPAYKPVLDLHGWGDLQTDLNALSKQGRWDEMVPLVDDEILDAMCASGTETEVAATLRERYGDVAHRVRFNRPGETPSPSRFAGLVEALRG